MPLDPFLEPLLSTLPPLPDPIDDFDAWRKQSTQTAEAATAQLSEPGPAVAGIQYVSIPVPGGTIDLKVYQPSGQGPHSAHLFIHGGGWFAGSIHDTHTDNVCRERSAGAGCVVVAVNYRKAPEHPFPVPLDDCHAAVTWLIDHANELGVRPDRLTIGGQSAGANLAAALTLKLRDEQGPRFVLQLLECPPLDLTLSQPSYAALGTGYGLDLDEIRRMVAWYTGDNPELIHDPYLSPLLADDLSDLPPAYVMTSEYDPLRDDGELYVHRLHEAHRPATISLQHGHIHGSSAFTKVMPTARQWRDETLAALRNAYLD